MDAIEHELWRRARQDEDQEARDFLFLRYSPWARSIAGMVARRTQLRMMEWDDHVQNAQLGLLDAMSRFDAGLGVYFMVYAKPRVRGAVFNGMRKMGIGDGKDVIVYDSHGLYSAARAWWVLRWKGVPTEVCIGMQLSPDGAAAHAWLEYEGIPVNDLPDIALRYPIQYDGELKPRPDRVGAWAAS